MKVSVFGTGYVGLVQAAVMAHNGHHVVCVDIDPTKIAKLKRGIITIYEPGLSDMVLAAVAANMLEFTTDSVYGVAHGDISFIAVGTPSLPDGSADLSAIFAVATTIATHRTEPVVVVQKSTAPVGTCVRIQQHIEHQLNLLGKELEFDIASNPEFLKEGTAVEDCTNPDRVVIGTQSDVAKQKMTSLYSSFGLDKLVYMDCNSAELTKYAANCMLATRITFMNTIANIAEALGANIEDVKRGIAVDPRIGKFFLNAGCGYGGSCFPKDVRALISTADDIGASSVLLKAVDSVNNEQKYTLFKKMQNHFDVLAGKVVAVWGLAFKPDTDDVREAPSHAIVSSLLATGAIVRVYDPEGQANFMTYYPDEANLIGCISVEDTVSVGVDAIVVCTEWSEFRGLVELAKTSAQAVFDGRNIFDPKDFKDTEVAYFSVGR